ncbi:MAG: DUF2190 family protein [Oxalobacter formigenes]|nr:DUF2190 family protein [Oxalobacter formigenes]
MQKIPVLTLTLQAADNLAAERFVTADGHIPKAGGHALGVTTTVAAPGSAVAADVMGTTLIEAGGVIALGQGVQSDASGKAVALSGGVALGTALQAASADGERIEVLLTPVAPEAASE